MSGQAFPRKTRLKVKGVSKHMDTTMLYLLPQCCIWMPHTTYMESWLYLINTDIAFALIANMERSVLSHSQILYAVANVKSGSYIYMCSISCRIRITHTAYMESRLYANTKTEAHVICKHTSVIQHVQM